MTWNLWWRFGPWERRQDAILAVLREQQPDVVCLQETWSTDGEDQAAVLAEGLGYHAAVGEAPRFDGMGFANSVISRWPVEVVDSVPLPRPDGRPGHRRAVAVRVDTPWGEWPFVTTHVDHRFDASDARECQLVRVLELVADLRGDPERDLPVVVGGDLNATPDSDEIRLVTGRRQAPVRGLVLNDLWEQAGDGPGHTWTRDNPYSADTAWPRRRLDYLMVSWPRPKPVGNAERAWLAGDGPVDVDGEAIWPSDHAAVVADLITP
jgi:endonuclease/exonuclease/phosphatase family metal-dependent hydrolase